MSSDRFDIVMIADPRFSGGTTAALDTDVRGFAALGAKVGLVLVHSNFLREGIDKRDPRIDQLLDLDQVSLVAQNSEVSARLAFYHHPMVFFDGIDAGARIAAETAVVVAHHPPFRGDGSLEYDPALVIKSIRRSFGGPVMFAPISGAVRKQLTSFVPLITLTSDDWVNSFQTDLFPLTSVPFQGDRVTIGRHGRVDPLKWPDRACDVEAALPVGPETKIRVMGCPRAHLQNLGVDMAAWDILDFNSEPVGGFLGSLDVFSYFYSNLWVESFGRTIAEAALCGAVCVLDRRLEPTFGDIGFYCEPAEVADVIARLRDTPDQTRQHLEGARQTVSDRYGLASLQDRWTRLLSDTGTRSRRFGAAVPPQTTLRKTLGLYRRRMSGGV